MTHCVHVPNSQFPFADYFAGAVSNRALTLSALFKACELYDELFAANFSWWYSTPMDIQPGFSRLH